MVAARSLFVVTLALFGCGQYQGKRRSEAMIAPVVLQAHDLYTQAFNLSPSAKAAAIDHLSAMTPVEWDSIAEQLSRRVFRIDGVEMQFSQPSLAVPTALRQGLTHLGLLWNSDTSPLSISESDFTAMLHVKASLGLVQMSVFTHSASYQMTPADCAAVARDTKQAVIAASKNGKPLPSTIYPSDSDGTRYSISMGQDGPEVGSMFSANGQNYVDNVEQTNPKLADQVADAVCDGFEYAQSEGYALNAALGFQTN